MPLDQYLLLFLCEIGPCVFERYDGEAMMDNPNINAVDILTEIGINSVTSITPVSGGSDTTIWRVEHGTLISALRVFRREQLEPQKREIEAMDMARQAGVPTPIIRASGVWNDWPFLLLSWCPGVTLWEAIRREPWRIWSLGKAFGRTQALIHRVRSRESWQHQRIEWINWKGLKDNTLFTNLQQIANPELTLLHLDYHPSNILTDGRQITGVLDWTNSYLGDARADIARTYTILRVEPLVPGRHPIIAYIARLLLSWGWRRGYKKAAGKLHKMAWFYVWAGTVMERDLAPRVNDSESLWQSYHLEKIRNWTTRMRKRAS